MKLKKDMVNSPEHYRQYKIINGEVIDLIEEVTIHYPVEVAYHIGNAIKYILRAPFKNNMIQDLKKSVYHLNRAVERLNEKEET